MMKQYKILSQGNCGQCLASSNQLQSAGLFDQVEFVDVNTDYGMELAIKHNIMRTGMDVIMPDDSVIPVSEFIDRMSNQDVKSE